MRVGRAGKELQNEREREQMAKTKDRISESSRTVRPYVERAIKDEDVRDNLRDALAAAREIYDELLGSRGVTTMAARVATDEDLQKNLRRAVEDLRKAADRVQGKDSHKARKMLLFAGVIAGVLLNPMTGPATREWLKSLVGGGDKTDYAAEGGTRTNSS
ncbi:MAG: hypothetical protein ABR583_13800 [Gaiellaceae bacterium]